MTSSIQAWFSTRPSSLPTSPPPARDHRVLGIASSVDGSAETRIVRVPGARFSFEVEAWTNFEDAGGNPHLTWHTFHPQFATRAESLETVVQLAEEDARERGLLLEPLQWLGPEGPLPIDSGNVDPEGNHLPALPRGEGLKE